MVEDERVTLPVMHADNVGRLLVELDTDASACALHAEPGFP